MRLLSNIFNPPEVPAWFEALPELERYTPAHRRKLFDLCCQRSTRDLFHRVVALLFILTDMVALVCCVLIWTIVSIPAWIAAHGLGLWAISRSRRGAIRRQLLYLLPDHCQACGYDLTGNESGVCPECGKSAVVDAGV